MSCEDIPSLLDLQKVKKHADDFGRLMGTGEGDSTNEVTGQVRPTYNKVMKGLGYTRVGTFASGGTLTNGRQTLLWDIADGGDGQEYGWSGAFPPSGKIVSPGSTPLTTGGIAVGAWMSRFDPELKVQVRESLRRSYAEAGYDLIGTFSNTGLDVNTATDVVLWEATGVAYSWAGTLPHTIAANETPIGNPSWTSKSNAKQGKVLRFGTVSEMLSDKTLSVGDVVDTLFFSESVLCKWVIASAQSGFSLATSSGLYATLVADRATACVEMLGASYSADSSSAISQSVALYGVARSLKRVVTNPVSIDVAGDILIDIEIAIGNFDNNPIAYESYVTGANVKFKATGTVTVDRLDVTTVVASAQVGGVAVSIDADNIVIEGANLHHNKLALSANESLNILSLNAKNESGGSIKVNNAQLYATITKSNALLDVDGMRFLSYPTNGSNQDIIKISGNLPFALHPTFTNNTIVNLNPDAAAQVDIFTGNKLAQFGGNLLVNTQLHRKNTAVAGVPPDIRGTSLGRNISWFQKGYYTDTSLTQSAILFSGGVGSICGWTFLIETYLINGLIHLDAGAELLPEQAQDLTNISDVTVFAKDAKEGVNKTEWFIKVNNAQPNYAGKVAVSGCMVSGLKRFANLGTDNYSSVSDCQWFDAVPVGTAVSASLVSNFICDAPFDYAANNSNNVINGKKQEVFLAANATVDAKFQSVIFFSSFVATVGAVTNFKYNEPMTFINTGATAVTLSLPGGPAQTLAQYEAVTLIPYRVNNGTTIRWALNK